LGLIFVKTQIGANAIAGVAFAPLNEIQRVSTNFGYFEGRFSSSRTCLGGLIFNNLNRLVRFGGQFVAHKHTVI